MKKKRAKRWFSIDQTLKELKVGENVLYKVGTRFFHENITFRNKYIVEIEKDGMRISKVKL